MEAMEVQTPEEIISGLRTRLEVLQHDWLSDVDGLTEEADMAVQHYEIVVEELQEKRDRLRLLRTEFESLPNRAYRASLDEDALREEELRGRYAEVKDELPQLEDRVKELEAERLRLCPPEYSAAPLHGVEVRQHGPASRMSGQKREEAEKLADDIRDILDEFTESITKRDRSIKSYLHQHSEMYERVKRGEHV